MRTGLLDLCPRLDRHLRPLPIVEAPTPVERLDGLSAETGHGSLWIKRDDRTNAEYGGNKPRKLAFLLAHAIDRDRQWIVTGGAVGSNHLVATAIFARKVGVRVAGVVAPQPPSDTVRANLLSHTVLGTQLCPVANRRDLATGLARTYGMKKLFAQRPTLVLPGGSSHIGALGYVDAGIELARQVADRACDEPAAVVVPFGTGGTCAGLALGLAIAGLATEVVAVRVVEPTAAPRWLPWAILAVTASFLARAGLAAALRDAPRARLRIVDRYLGDGYGHPTPQGEIATTRFWDAARVRLEPTYSAKAAAAFLDMAADPAWRDRPLLFWLTFSAARPPGANLPPSSYLALPPELHGYFA